jgi:hypothetical protein
MPRTTKVIRYKFPCCAVMLLGCVPRLALAKGLPVQALLPPTAIGPRVEALTIFGGDFGLSDGDFQSHEVSSTGAPVPVQIAISKFGGDGEVGSPRPLGALNIKWQPLVQGNLGYLQSRALLSSSRSAGAANELRTLALEFGGGVRLWTTRRLSFAPTVMVLYGHTDDDFTPGSAYGTASIAQLLQHNVVDWSIATWTLRPAFDIQYILPLPHVIVTFSSDTAGFFTHGFDRSNTRLRVGGVSGFVTNKLDLNIPLGIDVFGHELHTGGYLSRTDLLGDLRRGLDVEHLNELHGRLVLVFNNPLWGMQWLGIGASYLWGTNISGWTYGADIEFHF